MANETLIGLCQSSKEHTENDIVKNGERKHRILFMAHRN